MVHSYSRVRQRRPGRSRWPLVAHAVLGRRHSQRRPHPSRVAGATRLARGGYGGDTRKSIQADANTNPATHEDPWALEEWRQEDCRADISAGWYRPGRAEVLLQLRCERQPSASCTPMYRQRKLVRTKSAPREQNTPTTETRPATSEQYR